MGILHEPSTAPDFYSHRRSVVLMYRQPHGYSCRSHAERRHRIMMIPVASASQGTSFKCNPDVVHNANELEHTAKDGPQGSPGSCQPRGQGLLSVSFPVAFRCNLSHYTCRVPTLFSFCRHPSSSVFLSRLCTKEVRDSRGSDMVQRSLV